MRKLSKNLERRLHVNQLCSRRETVYKFLRKRHQGIVPCFVCGQHVKEGNATLEHILPLSLGGTDDMDNLSISHYRCNQARGNNPNFSWDKKEEDVIEEEKRQDDGV